MMWLRKSKKGFTLIELMVVVAVIGVLALLGLRLYTGQQEKSKNAIVIANASTVHTLIQGDLLDHDYPTTPGTTVIANIGGTDAAGAASDVAVDLANMDNPFAGTNVAILATAAIATGSADEDVANIGCVLVYWVSANLFNIQGVGSSNNVAMLTGDLMTAQK